MTIIDPSRGIIKNDKQALSKVIKGERGGGIKRERSDGDEFVDD